MPVFLKSIRIIGFKSFPNSTEIILTSPITGIVGPNGSGKSNIVDAILWALGEQSIKKLRGDRAEDVIFAGAEGKHRLSFAEVSLIFSNETKWLKIDSNEVEITRRIFRSGESEFFINKTPARRKDISNLFAGTGLGKNSFFVVAQGKIEEIVNATPETLRAFIEEIAGVSNLITANKESDRKLQMTQENINRLKELTSELEREKFNLERQVEKLHRFNELKTRLSELEINLSAHTYRSNVRKMSEVKQSIKNLKEKLSEVRNRLSEIEKERKQIAETRQELIAREEELHSKLIEVERRKTELQMRVSLSPARPDEIHLWKEVVERLTSEKSKLKSEIESIEQQIKSVQQKTAELHTRSLELKQKAEHLNSTIFKLEAEREHLIKTISKTIADNIHELKTILQTAGEDEAEIMEALKQVELSPSQETISRLKSAVSNHFSKLSSSFKTALDIAEVNKLEEINEKLKKLTDERLQILTSSSEVDKTASNLTSELLKLHRELSEKEEKLKDVESQLSFYEEKLRIESPEESQVEEDRKELEKLESESAVVNSAIREVKKLLNRSMDREREIQIEESKLRSEEVELEKKIAVEMARESEYRTKIEYLADSVKEQYGVDIEKVEPTGSPENIEKEIRKLKYDIHSIGNINFIAEEELKHITERLENNRRQIEDLEKAKSDILKVMEKGKAEARRVMKETYRKMRESFRDVFTELFSGGNADLKMTNGRDILEGGFEIIAEPTGKKPQSISLLSGGEKSLTALALIFSALKVNPSPLVILDEADASLDDINIERFKKFVIDLSKETQFIIISHNQSTLEMCEVLYGVTMQTNGVSSVFSVRLEEAVEMIEESTI